MGTLIILGMLAALVAFTSLLVAANTFGGERLIWFCSFVLCFLFAAGVFTKLVWEAKTWPQRPCTQCCSNVGAVVGSQCEEACEALARLRFDGAAELLDHCEEVTPWRLPPKSEEEGAE